MSVPGRPSSPSPLLRRLAGALAPLAVALALLAPSVATAQSKIAVIDMRRAVLETEDGLRVQAKLKQLFDSRQTELEEKERTYGVAKTDFDRLVKSGRVGKEQLQQKAEALQQQALDLQNQLVSYRREMQLQEGELLNPIVQRLGQLVRQLASTSGYDMVLNKEAVPYFRSDLDVTDRIIQLYNAGLVGVDKPAAAPPAPPARAPAAPTPPSK